MQVSAAAAQSTNLDPAVRLPAVADRPTLTPNGDDSVGPLLAQLATPGIAMQVSAAPAAQGANLDPAVRLPAVADRPTLTPNGDDSVGPLLAQLATPGIANLIAHTPAPNVELRRDAVAALAASDVPRALALIGELVARNPHELDSVRHEPAFAPIRAEVEKLFQHHITIARADAEHKISTATHLLETTAPRSSRAAGMDPQQVLSAANELLATNQYVNVVLSGNLGQSIINYYGAAAADKSRKISGGGSTGVRTSLLYSGLVQVLADVARRVPLKVQIGVWFAIGLMSGFLALILRLLEVEVVSAALPLEIWGAGSIGLLGFGTYRRVRQRRIAREA